MSEQAIGDALDGIATQEGQASAAMGGMGFGLAAISGTAFLSGLHTGMLLGMTDPKAADRVVDFIERTVLEEREAVKAASRDQVERLRDAAAVSG